MCDFGEEGEQVEQRRVLGVLLPRLDGNAVVQVGSERHGVVVEDDHVGQRAVDDGEVLHKVVVHLQARLAVEPVVDQRGVAVLLDDVQQRAGVRRLRRGEDHHLVELAHGLQKAVHPGAQSHVDQRAGDRERKVGVAERVQRAVHQRLVEVQHEGVGGRIRELWGEHGARREGGERKVGVRGEDDLVERVDDGEQLGGVLVFLLVLAVRFEQRVLVGVGEGREARGVGGGSVAHYQLVGKVNVVASGAGAALLLLPPPLALVAVHVRTYLLREKLGAVII